MYHSKNWNVSAFWRYYLWFLYVSLTFLCISRPFIIIWHFHVSDTCAFQYRMQFVYTQLLLGQAAIMLEPAHKPENWIMCIWQILLSLNCVFVYVNPHACEETPLIFIRILNVLQWNNVCSTLQLILDLLHTKLVS